MKKPLLLLELVGLIVIVLAVFVGIAGGDFGSAAPWVTVGLLVVIAGKLDAIHHTLKR